MIKSHGNKLICRIDVTGFASVMVALLTLFFVRVWFQPDLPRIVVELPKALHAISMPRAQRENALTVTVVSDGAIYLGYRKVPAREVAALLLEGVRHGAEKRVYINADERVKYRTLKEVVDQVRLAGIERVSFLTGR